MFLAVGFFGRFPRNRPEPELSHFESIFVGERLKYPQDVRQSRGMYPTNEQ